MKSNRFLFLLLVFLICNIHLHAQVKKIDTTLKIGTSGYRVSCSNKNASDNIISITTIGFTQGARGGSFSSRGFLTKAEIGNLNDDAIPELLLYVFGVPNVKTGKAICMTVINNSIIPVFFPDIYDDPVLRAGYKGTDEFSIRNGILTRNFPLYKDGDADDMPTGGKRTIQYQMLKRDDGSPLFKILRSYDSAQ